MTDGTASKLPIRLKEARLQRGKTLEAVAEAIDSSLTTIWRYEAGQRRPSGPTLYALATLYNKPVEWFFGEEEESQASTEYPDADAPKSENIDLPDSDIARLAQLYRRMSPHARAAWLDVGEALLGPGHS